MIWNNIPNDERLHLWKQLRSDIVSLSLTDKLDKVAQFCFSMPVGTRTLDYYDPVDWPTPWEILHHGSFCTSSISLLIYYTIVLTNPTDCVELWLVEDIDGIYLLPAIDNQYILNYQLGKVNNYREVSDHLRVLQKYTKDQIKNIK